MKYPPDKGPALNSEINLAFYLSELLTISNFYDYSERVFQTPNVREELTRHQVDELIPLAEEYIKNPTPEALEIVKAEILGKVAKDIDRGLAILRRQILEAMHSLLEKYLCHLVRVYLHTFPELLKASEKQITFIKVAELKDNASIFDYAVEQEVSHFSRQSLLEKKKYLKGRLKRTDDDELWVLRGEDLWRDIDKKRQAIVHEEEIAEITGDYLRRAIHYINRLIFGLAVKAQVNQGVKFKWGVYSLFVKSKEKPTLKG